MAAPGGDSLAVLLPVPNLRAGIDWERDADRLRDALVADLEGTFGLTGPGRRGPRRAPDDAAGLRRATSARCGGTRSRSSRRCTSRPTSATRTATGGWRASTSSGGGTHPGAGVPGVLLGAEVTAGLVAADRGLRPRAREAVAA